MHMWYRVDIFHLVAIYILVHVAVPGRKRTLFRPYEFNTYINASGHCLHGSQSLVPLRMCTTSYGPQNTAHFGIAGHYNYCQVSKNQQKRSR